VCVRALSLLLLPHAARANNICPRCIVGTCDKEAAKGRRPPAPAHNIMAGRIRLRDGRGPSCSRAYTHAPRNMASKRRSMRTGGHPRVQHARPTAQPHGSKTFHGAHSPDHQQLTGMTASAWIAASRRLRAGSSCTPHGPRRSAPTCLSAPAPHQAALTIGAMVVLSARRVFWLSVRSEKLPTLRSMKKCFQRSSSLPPSWSSWKSEIESR